jgi:hypothetical protein
MSNVTISLAAHLARSLTKTYWLHYTFNFTEKVLDRLRNKEHVQTCVFAQFWEQPGEHE